MKKWLVNAGVMMVVFLSLSLDAYGAEREQKELCADIMEEAGLTLDELEQVLEESSLSDSVTFSEILEKLWQGKTDEVFKDMGSLIGDKILGELSKNKRNIIQIVLLAIFAALFSNLATGMFSATLQETGFFTVYLALTGIVLQSFYLMHSVTEEALAEVFSFMEVFIPAYAIAITMVSGSASSIALYEMTFFLIKGCQWVLKAILLPMVEAYMVVGIVNYIGETNRFSNLGRLIQKGAEQILKWGTGIVLGLNLIQNMILPAVDSLKSTIWQRGMAAIPGAGDVISMLTGGLLGASVLIKNSIGVGCLIILLLFCAVPIVKLIVFILSFSFCSAFLQPITDKRFIGLLEVTKESSRICLQIVIACLTLFFITIALAAVSTNMRFYGG